MAGAGRYGKVTSRRSGPATAAAGFAAAVTLLLAGCGTSVGGAAAPSSIPAVTATATSTLATMATVTVTAAPATRPSEPTPTPSSAATEGSITAIKHPDACSLLTHREANALADLTLKAAVAAGQEHGVNTLCQYTRDPNLDGTAQVSVIIGDGAKKSLDIDKDILKHHFVKVAGIGDETWQEDDAIFVRVDTNWVYIGLVLLNDPSANATRMRQAAKIVAGRL